MKILITSKKILVVDGKEKELVQYVLESGEVGKAWLDKGMCDADSIDLVSIFSAYEEESANVEFNQRGFASRITS